jgi:hypothetical protein
VGWEWLAYRAAPGLGRNHEVSTAASVVLEAEDFVRQSVNEERGSARPFSQMCRIAAGAVLVIGATGCATSVPGVASPSVPVQYGYDVLDRVAAEQDIAEQFEETFGVDVNVDCGERMRVRNGATYECTGRTEDGEDVVLDIAITDERSASYTWDVGS